MDDLIRRQEAIDAVHKEFDDCIVWDESGMTTANEVESILDSVPSAQPEPSDAVYRLYKRAYEAGQRNAQPEIVRCKDCKYGEQDEIGRWYCRGLGCQMGDDEGNGFCSDAERREE